MDTGGGVLQAQIAKALVPYAPDSFDYWESLTGTGTPTSNPVDWFLDDVSPASSSGTNWVAVDLIDDPGFWVIARVNYGGLTGDWSNKVLM